MIDNGRGCNTHSKRCSIRCFRELKYNREDAAAIVELLILREDDADLLVPEKKDFSLDVRVRRVNRITCPIGRSATDAIVVFFGNVKRLKKAG